MILNSDVVFHRDHVRDGFGGRLGDLLRQCGLHGVTVIVPTTTALEFRCKQTLLAKKRRFKLGEASFLLKDAGVDVADVDYDELITVKDLPSLISAAGATCVKLPRSHPHSVSAVLNSCG